MRIKSFITTIITIIISIIASIVLFKFNSSLIVETDSVKLGLAKVTLIVFYIIAISFSVPSALTSLGFSISSCFSDKPWVKVISIILLILSIGACVFSGYVCVKAYQIYFC